jgi:hypothetical protein
MIFTHTVGDRKPTNDPSSSPPIAAYTCGRGGKGIGNKICREQTGNVSRSKKKKRGGGKKYGGKWTTTMATMIHSRHTNTRHNGTDTHIHPYTFRCIPFALHPEPACRRERRAGTTRCAPPREQCPPIAASIPRFADANTARPIQWPPRGINSLRVNG